jgi:parallel beta-helix repeat protein
VAVASVVLVCAFAVPVSSAVAETALTAIEDAHVDASLPTSNFGAATRLKTDGTPRVTIYLKFNVSGLPSPPSVAIRVFSAADNDTPFEVRTVADSTWSESTITAQNAPEVGPVIAASGPVHSNTWYTLDVSRAVTEDGIVSLALTTASSKASLLHSSEGTERPQLVIPGAPEPSPFVVQRSAPGSTVYVVDSASTGASYSGTLKSVVESAVNDLSRAGGGVIHFNAGLFELGDSQFELKDMVGVTFEGEGMDVTTISNSRSISADTEVFDVARATGGGIRDLTISAGGPARSTSDAIDYDAGNDQVIERVKVTRSRARGIVFDGKDVMGGIARGASNNVIRNCVVTNVPRDGVQLLAASNNRVEGCTITNAGVHGIQAVKASTSAGVPNKTADDNVILGNFVDQSGQDGINITSGNGNQVLGNTVLNSSNKTTARDGIKLAADNSIACNDNVVSGNTATDNQTKKTQRYGLAIVSALCNNTMVSGNNFAGNLTGEILDLGTGTTYSTPTPDTEAPSEPTGLAATATGATRVDLTWSTASDNVAVTGYTIYRDGTAIGTVGPTTPNFQDTTVSPETTYTYTVDAFDGADNRSAPSAPATATTPAAPPGPTILTLLPSDDAQVSESAPTSNFGAATTLRLDASPVLRSYLKFDVSGISGAITRATLRLYANSSSNTGFQAHGADDTSWTESTLTYANAPAYGAAVDDSGPFTAGATTEVDVTPLITGSGTYTMVLTSNNLTAMSLASGESGDTPQLVVETDPDAEPPAPDTEAPSVPTGVTATAVSPTQVDVAWSTATDNVAVTGYTVYRDGVALATVGAATTTFQDATASAETTYTYVVDAFDAAGNRSAQSEPASTTTPAPPPAPTFVTFAPTADAYVNESSPTSNSGALTTLRLDGSPIIRSYLKFIVDGITGPVTHATLRLYANSSSTTGYSAHGAADTTWAEREITFANAPPFDAAVGSSGSFAAGAYTDVDVTPLITANGTFTIVLTSSNTTALSLASRESAHPAELVLGLP